MMMTRLIWPGWLYFRFFLQLNFQIVPKKERDDDDKEDCVPHYVFCMELSVGIVSILQRFPLRFFTIHNHTCIVIWGIFQTIPKQKAL